VSEAPGGRGTLPVSAWLTVLAVLAASAGGGYLVHRILTPHGTTLLPLPPAETARLAAAAPGVAAATAIGGLKVPDEVPALKLPGLDGRPHSLADYRGKLLLINFWAPWCDPCRREIPLLKNIRRENAANGLEIVGIALDSRESVQKYATDHQITYPLLIAEQDALAAANAFGMDTVLPFSVFADRAGHVVALKVGELSSEDAGVILAGLEDLDHGRLSLKAAQARIAQGISLNASRKAERTPEGG
jgi:peroxiredoxin